MDFLQTKEYHVGLAEKTIDEIKAENGVFDANSMIGIMRESNLTSDEAQEVLSWLHEALNGDTEQHHVAKLTTKQCKYGAYLINAIHDCVTMVI